MTAPRRLAPTPGTTFKARLERLEWAMQETLDPAVVAEVRRKEREYRAEPRGER